MPTVPSPIDRRRGGQTEASLGEPAGTGARSSSHASRSGRRSGSRRWALVVAVMAVVASAGASVAGPGRSPAAASLVAASGQGCAPGEGVTVVVDNGQLGGIAIGCAPGQQASGLAALAAAGFSVGAGASPGTVCTIGGVPAEGYPYCWLTGGFWSYWKKGSWGGAWGFSPAGPGAGPLPVDSVEGWYWAQGFASQAPGADESTAPPTTTTTTTTTSTEPSSTSDPSQGSTTLPGTTSVPGPTTPPPASGPGLSSALDWLEGELDRHDGALPAPVGDEPDWGLTTDALIALEMGGRSGGQAARQAWARFAPEVSDYTTGASWGDPGASLVGPLAKTLLVSSTAGATAPPVDEAALGARLRGLLRTTGPDAGRFSDSPSLPDATNGYTQALAVLGLGRTTGVPATAVEFLLGQQCPSGGFRIDYSTPGGCTDDGRADLDATALTVQALDLVDGGSAGPALTGRIVRARSGAIAWLLAERDPAGGYGGTGVTAALNSNSSGLAGQALRAAGRTAEADGVAAWILGLQVSAGATGAARADAGAIAYNGAALEAARASGIGAMERDQWRRATGQAVLALGLPSFGAADGRVLGVEGARGGSGGATGAGGPTGGRALARTGGETTSVSIVGLVVLAAGLIVVGANRRLVHGRR